MKQERYTGAGLFRALSAVWRSFCFMLRARGSLWVGTWYLHHMIPSSSQLRSVHFFQLVHLLQHKGLRKWLNGKESTCQCMRHRFNLWIQNIPWGRKWQPTSVFLPGKAPGQRSLVGYSPWVLRVGLDWARSVCIWWMSLKATSRIWTSRNWKSPIKIPIGNRDEPEDKAKSLGLNSWSSHNHTFQTSLLPSHLAIWRFSYVPALQVSIMITEVKWMVVRNWFKVCPRVK